MSSPAPAQDLKERVEGILERAQKASDRPTDQDLGPCYNLLIPSPATSSTSRATTSAHWFCDRTETQLYRRAATYLIFLFAYSRQGTAQNWINALEGVVRDCAECARGFAIARREFASLYLSTYPPAATTNFFLVVDKWEIGFISREALTSPPSVSDLSTPLAQLFLSQPSLLDIPEMDAMIDAAIKDNPTASIPGVTALGVSPIIVRLLRSPVEGRRRWAEVQLNACGKRKLSFDAFAGSGFQEEIEELYGDQKLPEKIKWAALRALLKAGCLVTEAVERGLLCGESITGTPRSKKGILSVVVPLLSKESDYFSILLDIFTLLLSTSPNRSFWHFDDSPELPHTLFSDIKNNPSFSNLLESRYLTGSDIEIIEDKGKSTRLASAEPFIWIKDFLLSLLPESNSRSRQQETGFNEALARVLGDCFQDWQHDRLPPALRAAAAHAGLKCLTSVQAQYSDAMPSQEMAVASALDIHAKMITAIALRRKNYPPPIWSGARDAAHEVLLRFFRADGRDLRESMLGLSLIASEERKRQSRARKAKQKGEPVPPPVRVERLHLARAQKELWGSMYNALSPEDSAGAAILLRAVSSFAHVEKLNRNETWNYKDLRLQEVVREEDFVSAIRAINSVIVTTRDPFAQALESLAMQPDPAIIKQLWNQCDVPRSAIILLLSPAEDIHDPTISLIQQSFENVDVRGDCFRALLSRYPSQAMDGLCDFLGYFIETATITPESCSLAKWLVRCFTDVLDALCQSSEDAGPLLQTDAFLSSFADGIPMNKRIGHLWHLMTTSLAVIFKRTIDWAPLYDNETMVDWMRDALIFGRGMAEHIRAFEAAALGVAGSSARFSDSGDIPTRQTRTGAKLVQKLENVLRDLVSWLRLTDVETLHQTFQLIKTIVERIARTKPDISQSPDLELTLLELDKFSRKASKAYRSRLSDDLLSELSDLLSPFNLVIEDDEVQYVKSVEPTQSVVAEKVKTTPASSSSAAPPVKPKNAFEEMMRKAGAKGTPPSTTSSAAPGTKTKEGPGSKSSPVPIDDDDFDDGFFDNFSAAELDNLEKKAKTPSASTSAVRKPVPGGQPKLDFSRMANGQSSSTPKLNINVSSKPPPKSSGGSGFKSQLMRELQREHRMAHLQRDRNIGGIIPKIPSASGLGSGLGAYQGPRRTVQPVDSGSSASESSDEENRGMSGLRAKQKTPKKIARVLQAPTRPIKVLGVDMSDVIRQREDQKARQHALKMRLKPDLTKLYKYVLSWNPDHQGQTPAHPPAMLDEIGTLGVVPTVFPDYMRYRKVMLPLFLQELWMQSLKDGPSQGIAVEISSRSYEDNWIDMDLAIQGNIGPDFYVNDTDIVVLRLTPARAIMAKVQAFKKRFKDSALKVRILASADIPGLGVKAKCTLHKHLSLSTALREYGAIEGLPYYETPMLQNILSARSATIPRLTQYEIGEAKKSFDLNEPQAKAVLGAMDIEGFALIQGPPGTGKTKTISGLVGKFMSDRSGAIPLHGEKPSKAKLLVCAPSNAAIDEVCKRLMNGVPSASGGRHHPNIVRIGIESSVNIAVKSVSLDALVEARVNTSTQNGNGSGEYAMIQSELESVKRAITTKQGELQKARDNDQLRRVLEHEYQALIQKRTQLGQKSSKAKDAERDATRHLEGARRAARQDILNEADIICATLSGAGQDNLAPFTFETVIIDEAAQAIEMSCLIPLKYGARRCIMVGDPNQLPPTTFSSDAERFHYNESLFVRMVKQNPANVQLLSIQYRMNPYISELPSKVFYNGQLKDGPDMAGKTAAIWHQKSIFGPYRFFNVDGQEQKQGTSTKNIKEALVAVELYSQLEHHFGDKVNFDMRIGVISMYKEQLWELKRRFMDKYGSGITERIEFNTVDGFQGQEKDIIILSCVRSGATLQSIGFLKDRRRMNVALTRARSSLFVIGNGPTLERSDKSWETIILDAKERGFYIDYDANTFHREVEPVHKKAKKEKVETKPIVNSNVPPKSVASNAQPLKRPIKEEPDVSKGKSTMDEPMPLKKAKIGPTEEHKRKREEGEISDSASEKRERKERKKEKRERREQREREKAERNGSPASTVSADSKASSVTSGPVARPAPPGPSKLATPGNGHTGPAGVPRLAPNKLAGSVLATPKPATDSLFIKKKKKPVQPGARPPGPAAPPGQSARSIINNAMNVNRR